LGARGTALLRFSSLDEILEPARSNRNPPTIFTTLTNSTNLHLLHASNFSKTGSSRFLFTLDRTERRRSLTLPSTYPQLPRSSDQGRASNSTCRRYEYGISISDFAVQQLRWPTRCHIPYHRKLRKQLCGLPREQWPGQAIQHNKPTIFSVDTAE
jgi:hypothetical protein